MKSVGEAMSLGRNFAEALQKAMRSIDKKGAVFHWEGEPLAGEELEKLIASTEIPTEGRLINVQQALRAGASVERLFEVTKIDPWFLDQICLINELAAEIAENETLSPDLLRVAKRHGFSDAQIAQIRRISEETVRQIRWAYGLHPVYKTVDTCAAEFAADTPYHYSSYDDETEVAHRIWVS